MYWVSPPEESASTLQMTKAFLLPSLRKPVALGRTPVSVVRNVERAGVARVLGQGLEHRAGDDGRQREDDAQQGGGRWRDSA